MNKTIGILALQGAYEKHVHRLSSLGFQSRLIRKPAELALCDALIIPGGESTTISLLIQEYAMFEPIKSFAADHPVMGVCAGMIMMASEVDDNRVTPLGLMPFRALRNYYGRQLDSFTTDITLAFDQQNPFRAHFIRAPGVDRVSEDIEVLARYNNEVIMMRSGQHMALSFHPELTSDARIHQYWLHDIHQAGTHANIQKD